MSKKRISKEKSIRHAKTTTEVIISLVLLGTCGFFAKSAFTDSTKVEQSSFYDNKDIASTDTTATTPYDPNQISCNHRIYQRITDSYIHVSYNIFFRQRAEILLCFRRIWLL